MHHARALTEAGHPPAYRHLAGIIAGLLTAMLLTACGAPPEDVAAPEMKTLSGDVWYRERVLLPPGYEITVNLSDVSKMDAAAEVLATTTFPAEGSPPFSWQLQYDASRIDPRHSYAVSARIERDGQLRFVSDTHTPAFDAAPASIMVVGVSTPPRTPAPSLAGRWRLEALNGESLASGAAETTPDIAFEADVVSGYAGCNRFTGGYRLEGAQLTLGELAVTMRACAEGEDIEAALLSALRDVRSAEVDGDELSLSAEDGRVLLVYRRTEPTP